MVVYLVSAAFLATLGRTGLLMLQGSGNVRAPAGIVWVEAVLNLVLSVVLGLVLGLTGVALATLVATALVSTTVGVPYICQSFGVPLRPFVTSILRTHVPAIAAAIVVGGWCLRTNAGRPVLIAAGAAIGGGTRDAGVHRSQRPRAAATVDVAPQRRSRIVSQS